MLAHSHHKSLHIFCLSVYEFYESGSFFTFLQFLFYYSKVLERGKQICNGKKKFNMDPKKVNF